VEEGSQFVEAAVEEAPSQAGVLGAGEVVVVSLAVALAEVEEVACVRVHCRDKDVSAMGGGGSAREHSGGGNPRLGSARGLSSVRVEKARRRRNAPFTLEQL
jgi:hypothetical protein